MNPYIFVLYTLLLHFSSSCQSQKKNTSAKSKTETERVYIMGSIRDKQTKETIPFATYSLFLSDTGSVWNGSVRRGISDQSGNYKIDITTLLDSTETLVLRSKYIRYALTHVILKGKIKNTIQVDIELIGGGGDYYSYYIVCNLPFFRTVCNYTISNLV